MFSLLAAGLAMGFMACNNSSNTTSSTDSTSTGTAVSSGNYAARADSVKTNVEAGNYLNPKTGKAYTRLTVDPQTGVLTDESGTPVRRYVDKRTWWVYDAMSWDTVGSAEQRNGSLWYRNSEGAWVPYEKRWSDDNMQDQNQTDTTTMSPGSEMKIKTDAGKIKADDKGVKVKPNKE